MTTMPSSSSRSKRHPLKLLLVDDNPDVLSDLKLLLELSGDMKIAGEALNGHEAVDMAGKFTPDVVVMDLEMPGMDGYEATRLIKSQPFPPRVIILSVHAGPGEMERARASGADEFIVKGSSYETLRNAIRGTEKFSNSSKPPG